MRRRELKTAGIGGLDLYAQAWLPESHVRAVVVVAHGLGEHSGRYAGLAEALVGSGHAVYALDHRGHGHSPGARANIERFEYLVSDFGAFAGRAARQHPDTPVFVLGHSMGGAVAFASALRLQNTLRGVVLSAPALGTDDAAPNGRKLLARVLSSVAPNTGVWRIEAARISRDPTIVQAYASDPLVHHGPIPARTVVELLDAMQGFLPQAPRLRLPSLVLHGTADSLVPVSATRPLYQALDAQKRTVKYYEGLFHEVFNEPERAQVIDDLQHWLARV
ncbi:MAG TPA: alpha/beta hydrolase [Steroidobacteraceae bacterium]|jgi:acylglycerol lipase|nr:alpha/beta hydrolase [Steroidobacteraceae bacterium]